MNGKEVLGRAGCVVMVGILLLSIAVIPVGGTPTETAPENNSSGAGDQPTDQPPSEAQGQANENATNQDGSTETSTTVATTSSGEQTTSENSSGGSAVVVGESESWWEAWIPDFDWDLPSFDELIPGDLDDDGI